MPDAAARSQWKTIKFRAARYSLAASLTLVTLKLGVSLWIGSISVGSEALHSATDLLAASFAFLSVRIAEAPPDCRHPYGHGKIESLSALFEALLIFAGAALIIVAAVSRLHHSLSLPPQGYWWGTAAMAISALLNLILSAVLKRAAHLTGSQALNAESRHLFTDVTTSLGVLTGLIVEKITGMQWIDPILGMILAGIMIAMAVRLLYDALQPLMDVSLPPQDEKVLRNILETEARVMGYHKLRTRSMGAYRESDVHVQAEDTLTLLESHALAEELEDRVRRALPGISISIHMEPYREELRHQQEAHGASIQEKNTPEPSEGAGTHSPPMRGSAS